MERSARPSVCRGVFCDYIQNLSNIAILEISKIIERAL